MKKWGGDPENDSFILYFHKSSIMTIIQVSTQRQRQKGNNSLTAIGCLPQIVFFVCSKYSENPKALPASIS